MAAELSGRVRPMTFALMVLASAATEIAAVDARPVWMSLALATAWAGLAAGLAFVVPAPKQDSRLPPRSVLILLLLLGAAPFVLEPFRRQWMGTGYPLEVQMVFGLRNLGLGLAACAVWTLCLRLACVVSLFLILFANSMTDHPGVLTLLGLYGAAGSVWLMLTHWVGLHRYFAASEAVGLEVQREREPWPWPAMLVVVGLLSLVLSLITAGPQRAARVLAEWLPTSGGTGGYDPFARGGTNDGDDEVKGNHARSTGTIETDLFLNSPLPSLYDIANDLYGEPFKPQAQERAIPLDAKTRVRENETPPADNQRPNREFATARKGPRQPRDASDRAARALFEVQGRTPLHVRVTAYDGFDGQNWQEAALELNTCLLDKERGSTWMRVKERKPGSIFAENEEHQFKITQSFGSLVPTPPHLIRFRLGRVDQANFFAWGQNCAWRMAQRKTPSGVTIETESRTVDPRMLATVAFSSGPAGDRPEYTSVPPNLHPEVSALAQRWAGTLPMGWAQIAAIVRHLRTEYIHDPLAHTPAGCDDPLGHFLFHSRRGADYQFASAAAVLLRVLGYATRLMCGFYVSPDHYDPQTRHTPVVQEDLHFWAEVMLPWGGWLVIESTPGYEVLGPNLPWSERLGNAFLAAGSWARQHLVELSVCLLMAGGLWWWRGEVLDAVGTMAWHWLPGGTWQQCVRRALWLLERRGRWAGRPRRACQTTRDWLSRSLPGSISPTADIEALNRMAEWAIYASDLVPPWPRAEVHRVCGRAVKGWTLRRWRKGLAAKTLCGVG